MKSTMLYALAAPLLGCAAFFLFTGRIWPGIVLMAAGACAVCMGSLLKSKEDPPEKK